MSGGWSAVWCECSLKLVAFENLSFDLVGTYSLTFTLFYTHIQLQMCSCSNMLRCISMHWNVRS